MNSGVVITGVGIVSPICPFDNMDLFWNTLCSGKDAVRRTSLPLLDFDRKWLAASVDLNDSQRKITPENKLMFIADKALRMTMDDAGFSEGLDAGLSVGTVLGNILYKEKKLIKVNEQKSKTEKEDDGRDIEKSSLSYVTEYLAAKYMLGGPKLTVSTACASGTDALGIAARKIWAGETDIMVAGGVDVLSDFAIFGFDALQALTDEKVRPFDRNRSGLALGEGAAFVVLESEAHALGRGARLYGKVLGYASRSDATHLTSPHREGRGLADAIKQAVLEAGLNTDQIGYINAHGTGTVYNDLMETKAIKRVFGRAAYDIPVSSTKSMLGHSFGAAGIIEAVCCLYSIKTGIIHPTINFQERDPECDLNYVPNAAMERDVNVAMSLSAGFGGQNSAVVLKKA